MSLYQYLCYAFYAFRPGQSGLVSETQELRNKIRDSGNAKIVNGLSSAARTMEIVFAEVEKILKAVRTQSFVLFCFVFLLLFF